MFCSKLIKTATLALALVIGSSVVTAPKAHAYLLIEGASGMTPADGPWDQGFVVAASYTALCIVVLPICLLDEKSDGSTTVTKAHLAANGYSKAEISAIMADQKITSASLKNEHMKLQVLPSDTRESITRDILAVNPTASATYVNFMTDSIGL